MLLLADMLAPYGLLLRGGLRLEEPEVQALNASTLFLVGHAGSSIWPHFVEWRKSQSLNLQNPLDTWSKQAIGAVAASLGGRAVFPSDKPYLPFQKWAMRAEGLRPSPLGILIHPKYGLWHAYRGAVVFDEEILIQEPQVQIHACDLCLGKPCLSACPVGAFSGEEYHVGACWSHLATEVGKDCMNGGCKSRLACPVGHEYAYVREQMRFHMDAFAK